MRQLGPLWAFSCFHFEDCNGFLLKLIHGTQSVQFQIVSAISILQGLPVLSQDYLKGAGEKALKLYKRLRYGVSEATSHVEIEAGIFKLGGVVQQIFTASEFRALAIVMNKMPDTDLFKIFYHCKVKNISVNSEGYSKCKVRNSYTVIFSRNSSICVGSVEFFFQYKEACKELIYCADECTCPVYNLAMMKLINLVENSNLELISKDYATGLHFRPVAMTDDLIVIPIQNILNKCCIISSGKRHYVSMFPNNCERD